MLFTKISALCKERNISVAKLEQQAGLGNATVRRWDVSTPTVDNLKRVADVLGCTVDDLLKEY